MDGHGEEDPRCRAAAGLGDQAGSQPVAVSCRSCRRLHPRPSRRRGFGSRRRTSNGMGAGRHRRADLEEVCLHPGRVAPGGSRPCGRADGAEDAGPRRALVVGRARPRAAPRPSAGDLVLLPDPRLVGASIGLPRASARGSPPGGRGSHFLDPRRLRPGDPGVDRGKSREHLPAVPAAARERPQVVAGMILPKPDC
jgi:hypothetical protein